MGSDKVINYEDLGYMIDLTNRPSTIEQQKSIDNIPRFKDIFFDDNETSVYL